MSSEGSEWYLEVVIDSEKTKIPLEAGQICRIGRGDQNTVALVDNQVSRNHAVVQGNANGQFTLTDVGSRNGTFVNRRRVSAPVVLKPGDHIKIGQHEFLLHGTEGAGASREEAVQAGETVVDISQKLITVLVTDVRNFTGLSRRLDEGQLSKTMGSLFREAGQVLADYGAFGQKYIGDAIMAFWVHATGTPSLFELYEMTSALRELFDIVSGLQAKHSLDCPIRIGAGMNTGLASVGNIGSTAASDHTAVSEAVNLAFRLESATKHMRCDVALGPATYNLLCSHVSMAGLFKTARTELKGFDGSWEVFTGDRESVEELANSLSRLLPPGATQIQTRPVDFKADQ